QAARIRGRATAARSSAVRRGCEVRVGTWARYTDQMTARRTAGDVLVTYRSHRVRRALLGECPDHVGDAGAQRGDVLGVDAREHGDAELVATELAVGL